jgi:hypothetical protein
VDALLDGLNRLIVKKRGLQQAAMQQLLTGRTRLPGFRAKWQLKELGEALTICHGKSQRSVQATDGSYPILATGGRIGTASRPLYDKPSVLIGRKGTIDRPQFMDTPFWSVDTLFYSVMKNGNSAKFFYYRFCLIDWMQFNEASGVPSLNAKTIERIEIEWPEPIEQMAIATMLSDMDAELSALEAQREKTRALKQGMMRELLTGSTRIMGFSASAKSLDVVADVAVAPAQGRTSRSHNWQINEAVVLAMVVKEFGSEEYPLGRKRITKLSYLLHRHADRVATGYLKKAAGPYNPGVKYKGPESIAEKNGYVRRHSTGKHSGLVAGDKVDKAASYFAKWYGPSVLEWLEQFRFKSNDELELLATVDMTIQDLKRGNASITLEGVKAAIRDQPVWKDKLERSAFADEQIASAIELCGKLFAA